jgi:hypothetical protein
MNSKLLFYPICLFSGIYLGKFTSNFSYNSNPYSLIDIHIDFDEINDKNDSQKRTPVITILSKKSNSITDLKLDDNSLKCLEFCNFKITKTEKKSNNLKWNNDIVYRFENSDSMTSDQDAEIYKDWFKQQCGSMNMRVVYTQNGEEKFLSLNEMRKFV